MSDPTTSKGPAPVDSDESDLEPNAIHCLEDDGFTSQDGAPWECPDAGPDDHPIETVHVTPTPLGYSDDGDYYHFGLKSYVYPAKDPR